METIFRWEVTGLIGYTAASAMTGKMVEPALTGSLEARATIFLSWGPDTTLVGVVPMTITSLAAPETIFCLAEPDMTRSMEGVSVIRQGEDTLEFQMAGVSGFDDLDIVLNGSDTVIGTTASATDTVTLVGFTGTLTESDFLLS